MVKKIVQRVIVGVLVSLILGLIYSVIDANALEITSEVKPTGRSYSPRSYSCAFSSGVWTNNQANCSIGFSSSDSVTSKSLFGIRPTETFDFKQNYFYEFLIMLGSSTPASYTAITWFPSVDESNWSLVTYQQLTEEQMALYSRDVPMNTSETPNISGNYTGFTKIFRVILQSKKDQNNIQFGTGTNTLFIIRRLSIQNNTTTITMSGSIAEFKCVESAGDIMQQDKEENQQQGQESESNANQTEQQTEENTQNLLGFLGSLFGAFTSAQSTNCNMNWGMSEYGFGNIDVCSTNIPPVFQGVLSIVTLLFVVPMVYWLIHSIINAFKEFQE